MDNRNGNPLPFRLQRGRRDVYVVQDLQEGARLEAAGGASGDDLPTGTESEDSDPEDPAYLTELCKGFTTKIKEKGDTIRMYKKALFNNQLQLVKREAFYQRKLRRMICKEQMSARVKEVTGAGTSRDVEGARDAALVFPEEIWVMILESVTGVKDLRNCSKTCTLVNRVLEESKPQWLFAMIFPFVYPKLRRKDILKCRLVCSRWCSAVDDFLAKFYTIISPDRSTNLRLNNPEEDITSNVSLKSFHFEYNFSIPPPDPADLDSPNEEQDSDSESAPTSLESLNRSHDRCRAKMLLHTRNPFIGRSVTIEEDSTDFEHIQDQANGRTFVTEAERFLSEFGEHIWHLSICCNMDVQTPSKFYRTCLTSLTKCPDLKSLCLAGDLNWRVRRNTDAERINNLPPPADRPSLESLQIDVDGHKIFQIQNKLVQKYSDQLKRLEVQVWNPELYYLYSWSTLRELQINKGNSEETLNSLLKTNCPNLRSLSLRMVGNGPFFTKILELANRFPKLNHLQLKFESRFGGFKDDELAKLPEGLCCSAAMTHLELTSSVTDISSFNFLLYLPYLQRLVIRHGHWTNYNLRDATAPYLLHRAQREEKDIMENCTGSADILKIAKYIQRQPNTEKDCKLMYRSNVWKILPFLQNLDICNARYVPEKKSAYTRSGYEYYLKMGQQQLQEYQNAPV